MGQLSILNTHRFIADRMRAKTFFFNIQVLGPINQLYHPQGNVKIKRETC